MNKHFRYSTIMSQSKKITAVTANCIALIGWLATIGAFLALWFRWWTP